MENLANKLVTTLRERKLSIALAESMTCGMAAHRLGNCVGVSEIFKGSIVCYSPEIKTDLVGVSAETIEKHTCESAECTAELADGLFKLAKADIHAAITGLATSDGSETKEKPVGTVFFTVKYRDNLYKLKKHFTGPPLKIKTQACLALYQLILTVINNP